MHLFGRVGGHRCQAISPTSRDYSATGLLQIRKRLLNVWLLGAAGLWLAMTGAIGAEPPSEPQLRVETGTHTGVVSAIATDAKGRWTVTGGRDQTARVWETSTGQLLKTLRLPLGATEAEGRVYAVGMSPDGTTIAVAGQTGFEWDGLGSVYLFERTTGILTRRVDGLAAPVVRLSFSPDGSRLAIGLASKGIVVVDASGLSTIGADAQYTGTVTSISFSSDSSAMATTSTDGRIRIYDSSTRELAKRRDFAAVTPVTPLTAAQISPDGSLVAAISRTDSLCRIVVASLDGSVFQLGAQSDAPSAFHAVAWSSDGRSLHAAGDLAVRGSRLLRTWSASGRGPSSDLPLGNAGTIQAIATIPDGRLVVAAFSEWAVVSKDGQGLDRLAGSQAVRPKIDSAGDARVISVSNLEGGASPVQFSVERGLEEPVAVVSPKLKVREGVQVAYTSVNPEPKVNGSPVEFPKSQRLWDHAIAPDGSAVAFASSIGVVLVDKNGRRLWFKATANPVFSVAVSDDSRWVIAAAGDATLRWLNASTGKEALVVYLDKTNKKWVAWTPSGYFAASPGGEDLVGWHVNRGKAQAADFFPASRFRNTFYRPDIVEAVLKFKDEAEAIRQANASASRRDESRPLAGLLPPVLTVLSPPESTSSATSITVRLNIRSTSDAPVSALKARVNGGAAALPAEKNLTLDASGSGISRDLTIPLPSTDADVLIFAENRNGVSTPVSVRRIWAGPAQHAQFAITPKLYLLAIGVSKYHKPEYELGFAAKDAKDFAAAMKGQAGSLYRDVEIRLLTDEAASRDGVLDGLDWLRSQTTAKDVAMVFIAGHGINDQDGVYYFVPADGDVERIKRSGVVFSEVKNTLTALPGKAIFFIDTCHSGNILGGRRAVSDNTSIVNELASAENGVIVFSSSTGKQYSLENAAWGNGAFTRALLDGLTGKADLAKTGRITHRMLDFYVGERVKELTAGKQTPTTISPFGVADFPLAIVTAK